MTLRRNYEALDFDVSYLDGGDGWVAGPTEWDFRVSANAINEWILGMARAKSADAGWVSSIPNAPTNLDACEWHEDERKLVGIIPEERNVFCRNLAN